MKNAARVALAAFLTIGASARHNHGHRHLVKKHMDGLELQKRAVTTVAVAGPTVTVYEIDGQLVSNDKATKGLANGEYIIVGETVPTPVMDKVVPSSDVAPPSTSEASTTTTTTTSTASEGGQFIEHDKMDTTTTTTRSTPTLVAKPSPSPPAPKAPPKAAPPPAAGGGIDTPFESGKVPCSEFPSKWGAVPIPWMGMGGWSGIQKAPDFKIGDFSISLVITGIVGDGCEPNDFCSYACPIGYQKTQWPSAQGADLKSIGGLYCNANGMLELTREDHPTLCEKGAGGVYIKNDLDQQVSTCRTDYPGTECMVIPVLAAPGSTVELTSPDQTTYYIWDNKTTSAQYYVNPKGLGPEDACLWNSPTNPDSAGNFSPMNLGTSCDEFGITYLSIFPNSPSSTAVLNFNIEIKGSPSMAECYFIDGKFPPGKPDGCTSSFGKGESAIVRYFER